MTNKCQRAPLCHHFAVILPAASLQFWDSISPVIKPTQQGLTLQVGTSAAAVLPGKPLGALLTVPGGVEPSDLTSNKKQRAEAEQLIKGAKVSVRVCRSGSRVGEGAKGHGRNTKNTRTLSATVLQSD